MTRQLAVGYAAQLSRSATTLLLENGSDGDGCPDGPTVVGRVRRALAMLRDPTSAAQLASRIPVATAVLGFDCAVYAQLTGQWWQPVASFGCVSEDEPAPTVVAIGPQFVERAALEHRTPILVDESHEHRLMPTSWCRSYVVVPVVERGVILGLIHAGHRDPAGRTEALDREVLWTFAEALGAGFASARAVDTLRDLVMRMTKVAGEFGSPAAVADDRDLVPTASLTARELEVLELMAVGQTNSQIARRLVITEGTAKSHVKRIMRKLRAANRAEAVAAWIRCADRVLAVERV